MSGKYVELLQCTFNMDLFDANSLNRSRSKANDMCELKLFMGQ